MVLGMAVFHFVEAVVKGFVADRGGGVARFEAFSVELVMVMRVLGGG